jgi:hypothetical protein
MPAMALAFMDIRDIEGSISLHAERGDCCLLNRAA